MSADRPLSATPEAVAAVARLLARAGLVQAFGHVSARDGDQLLITSTAPLLTAAAEEVLSLPADPARAAEVVPELDGVPLEWPLHAAVYQARPDLGAICRTHSPAAVNAGLDSAPPPMLHGLGGLAGQVELADGFDLVTSEPAASLLAAELGAADCLLVRGNGVLATGADLSAAAVRAWFLEERCRVALASPAGVSPPDPAAATKRADWHGPETDRAWRWLRTAFGDLERDLEREHTGASASQQRGVRDG